MVGVTATVVGVTDTATCCVAAASLLDDEDEDANDQPTPLGENSADAEGMATGRAGERELGVQETFELFASDAEWEAIGEKAVVCAAAVWKCVREANCKAMRGGGVLTRGRLLLSLLWLLLLLWWWLLLLLWLLLLWLLLLLQSASASRLFDPPVEDRDSASGEIRDSPVNGLSRKEMGEVCALLCAEPPCQMYKHRRMCKTQQLQHIYVCMYVCMYVCKVETMQSTPHSFHTTCGNPIHISYAYPLNVQVSPAFVCHGFS